jgi:microcystin-dependent protein
MSCSNCYNGCAEITSDKCVKYTGVDVPVLGIKNGDSLSYVEQSLIGFITSMLDGEGIVLNISSNVICDIVDKYLVDCETLNLPNVINALLRAVCEVNQKITAVEADIATLNANYTIGCLTGVTASSDTHDILQATITKLCSVDAALTALAANVSTNYVNVANINSYIAAYIESVGTNTNYYNRMVPYTVVEYYGSLTGFDVTGKGTGLWDKIYLCNGNNGTPDKRGRVPVGATTGMGGGAMNSAVDPAVAGNPAYALLGTAGANTITLSVAQMPAHTHVATVTIVDPGHTHTILGITGGDNNDNNNTVRFAGGDKVQGESSFYFNNTEACQSAPTGLNNTNVSVSNASTGGGLAHNNYQPALGCYYIMYIP